MKQRTLPLAWIVLLALVAFRAPLPQASGVLDPDYYWHVAYGELILDTLRLPTLDTWSWTMHGHPYTLTQWAGELVMGLAHRAGGELGTGFLSAALAVATIAACYRTVRLYLHSHWLSLSLSIVCNSLLLQLPSRPHQWTHLGLALLNLCVLSYLATRDRRWLYPIPLLFAAWVNLHGGYAFGLAYFGLFIITVSIDAWLVERKSLVGGIDAALVLVWTTSLMSTLLNPYGAGAWRYALEIASLKTSTSGVIAEWVAPTIQSETGLLLFGVSIAAFAGMALCRTRPTPGTVLRLAILLALGWTAVRMSVMVLILMVPLLAAALASTPFYERLAGMSAHYDAPRSRLWAGLFLIAIAFGAYWMGRTDKTVDQRNARYFPVAEAQFLVEHGLDRLRVLNTPESGGYLIRRHGMRVAIDTRLDLYGDRAYFAYIFASQGLTGWQDYISQLDPEVIIANQQVALRELLVQTGTYRPIFEGEAHTVLLRHDLSPHLPSVPLRNVSAIALQNLR